jgi:phage shock protein C
VRITFVVLLLAGGIGAVLYLIAMIVVPAEPADRREAAPTTASSTSHSLVVGVFLIALGVLLLLSNFGVRFWHFWWGLSWPVLWPLLMIAAGVAFLFTGRERERSSGAGSAGTASGGSGQSIPSSGPQRLYRSQTERKLLGVCGGLAEFLNTDPTIIRILFIVGGFISLGFVLVLYVLMGIIVPKEPVRLQAA